MQARFQCKQPAITPMTTQGTRLMDRLRGASALIAHGFDVSASPSGDVLIERHGHVYAIWQIRIDGYHFLPTGHSEATYITKSIDDAVALTERRFMTFQP